MNPKIDPDGFRVAGETAYQKGEYLEAARQYEKASHSRLQAGDKIAAAEMANNCSVALLQAGEAQAALDAVTGTVETFAEAGEMRRQAMAWGNLAAAFEELNRIQEAEEAYRHSADLLAQLGEDELRVSVMRSLSALQLRSGRQLEAVASMQAGLEGLERPSAKQRLVKKLLQLPFKFITRT